MLSVPPGTGPVAQTPQPVSTEYRIAALSFDHATPPPRWSPVSVTNLRSVPSPTLSTCSSGVAVYIAQNAICLPSGETASTWGANWVPAQTLPDSLRIVACGGPSPPLTTKPKSSLYMDDPLAGEDAVGVGVAFGFAFGFAVGLGRTSLGRLVVDGVGDELGFAALCW